MSDDRQPIFRPLDVQLVSLGIASLVLPVPLRRIGLAEVGARWIAIVVLTAGAAALCISGTRAIRIASLSHGMRLRERLGWGLPGTVLLILSGVAALWAFAQIVVRGSSP
jgi:hypothetical protein